MLQSSRIQVGGPDRSGELCCVAGAQGLVVFAQANGNGVGSRRSAELAHQLQLRGLSTLVFDLVAPGEADAPAKSIDVEFLAQRLLQALDALPPVLHDLPLGLFGSGTGSAAALIAETRYRPRVAAVVSRAGRPDLAGNALASVLAPTLLLVGAADAEVLELNRRAYARLLCEKRIELVPRATRLFLEAGALDAVARHAGDWFCAKLRRPR
jgi:putative phosphoribosyl transferase